MNSEKLIPMICDVLGEVAPGINRTGVLFGEGGGLDSMGLLSLVVLLEERIQGATGQVVRLVTAEALSAKRSPFRTVGGLADYIAGLTVCPQP